MPQPKHGQVRILATDTDVTVTLGSRSRCYNFGLTGSELVEILESLGVATAYKYQEGRPHGVATG